MHKDQPINLYDLLSVDSDCSTINIKNAYQNLIKKPYPEPSLSQKHKHDEMFELIGYAYNILVDPLSRASYDHKMEKYNNDMKNDNKLKSNYLHYLISAHTPNFDFIKQIITDQKMNEFINEQNDNGDTPLILATKYGYYDLCTKLINHGADKSITNNDGFYVEEDINSKSLEESEESEEHEIDKYNKYDKYYVNINDIDQINILI